LANKKRVKPFERKVGRPQKATKGVGSKDRKKSLKRVWWFTHSLYFCCPFLLFSWATP